MRRPRPQTSVARLVNPNDVRSASTFQSSTVPVDFTVWTSRAQTGVFRCFTELAHSLAESLRSLGYTVAETCGVSKHSGQVIALGTNMLAPYEMGLVPADAIIYQLEQFSHLVNGPYFQLLRSHTVWDFSPRNVAGLRQQGCPRVRLCRVGFSPSPVLPLQKEKDIDVLFIGAKNARREVILNQLRVRGIKMHDSGAWGEERRELIARSKIVLNLHSFDHSVLEMVRLGPMLEQGAFIVSEPGADPEMDKPFETGMVIAPYGNIVETVKSYLDRPNEREAISQRGTEILRAMPQKAEVTRCLSEMGHPKPSPVKCYIINRDRLTWTRNMVHEIRRIGGEPVIVDNASTYPPLLEWYASADCRVIRLDQNLGSRSPWTSGVIDREVKSGERYVVSDPDLDLSGVPSDALTVLTGGLDQYGVTKAGLSLEILDVPRDLLDVRQVNGLTLAQCEAGYWHVRRDERFWSAPTDTTFAMYRQGRPLEGAKFYEGVRADRPYTAKHLPWYQTEAEFDDEDKYYVEHRAKNGVSTGTWYDSVIGKTV